MPQTTVLHGDIGVGVGPTGNKLITIETAPGIIYEIPLTADAAQAVAKHLDAQGAITKGVPGIVVPHLRSI